MTEKESLELTISVLKRIARAEITDDEIHDLVYITVVENEAKQTLNKICGEKWSSSQYSVVSKEKV